MLRFPQLHERIVDVVTTLLRRRLPDTNEMVRLSDHAKPVNAANSLNITAKPSCLVSWLKYIYWIYWFSVLQELFKAEPIGNRSAITAIRHSLECMLTQD